MKKEKYVIWEKEEYSYAGSFGFIPHLMSYIHEDDGHMSNSAPRATMLGAGMTFRLE